MATMKGSTSMERRLRTRSARVSSASDGNGKSNQGPSGEADDTPKRSTRTAVRARDSARRQRMSVQTGQIENFSPLNRKRPRLKNGQEIVFNEEEPVPFAREVESESRQKAEEPSLAAEDGVSTVTENQNSPPHSLSPSPTSTEKLWTDSANGGMTTRSSRRKTEDQPTSAEKSPAVSSFIKNRSKRMSTIASTLSTIQLVEQHNRAKEMRREAVSQEKEEASEVDKHSRVGKRFQASVPSLNAPEKSHLRRRKRKRQHETERHTKANLIWSPALCPLSEHEFDMYLSRSEIIMHKRDFKPGELVHVKRPLQVGRWEGSLKIGRGGRRLMSYESGSGPGFVLNEPHLNFADVDDDRPLHGKVLKVDAKRDRIVVDCGEGFARNVPLYSVTQHKTSAEVAVQILTEYGFDVEAALRFLSPRYDLAGKRRRFCQNFARRGHKEEIDKTLKVLLMEHQIKLRHFRLSGGATRKAVRLRERRETLRMDDYTVQKRKTAGMLSSGTELSRALKLKASAKSPRVVTRSKPQIVAIHGLEQVPDFVTVSSHKLNTQEVKREGAESTVKPIIPEEPSHVDRVNNEDDVTDSFEGSESRSRLSEQATGQNITLNKESPANSSPVSTSVSSFKTAKPGETTNSTGPASSNAGQKDELRDAAQGIKGNAAAGSVTSDRISGVAKLQDVPPLGDGNVGYALNSKSRQRSPDATSKKSAAAAFQTLSAREVMKASRLPSESCFASSNLNDAVAFLDSVKQAMAADNNAYYQFLLVLRGFERGKVSISTLRKYGSHVLSKYPQLLDTFLSFLPSDTSGNSKVEKK